MTHRSDLDLRDLEDLDEDLRVLDNRIFWKERAELDGRIADRAEWERSLASLRARHEVLLRERVALCEVLEVDR